ncbi:hypothetical protein AAC387_Pa08g2554 [Persea americana]
MNFSKQQSEDGTGYIDIVSSSPLLLSSLSLVKPALSLSLSTRVLSVACFRANQNEGHRTIRVLSEMIYSDLLSFQRHIPLSLLNLAFSPPSAISLSCFVFPELACHE